MTCACTCTLLIALQFSPSLPPSLSFHSFSLSSSLHRSLLISANYWQSLCRLFINHWPLVPHIQDITSTHMTPCSISSAPPLQLLLLCTVSGLYLQSLLPPLHVGLEYNSTSREPLSKPHPQLFMALLWQRVQEEFIIAKTHNRIVMLVIEVQLR